MVDHRLRKIANSSALPTYHDLLYALDYMVFSEDFDDEDFAYIRCIRTRATLVSPRFKALTGEENYNRPRYPSNPKNAVQNTL